MIAPAALTPTLSDHHLDLTFDLARNQDQQRDLQAMRDAADRVYLATLAKLQQEEWELWEEIADLEEMMAAERRARMTG